jgi:hypothetical protein
MALRNVAITPGSGDNVQFDSGNQVIKQAYGAEGASTLMDEKPATAAAQTTGNASLTSIDGKLPALSGGKVPVTDPVALPLPLGAATSALQTTGNTSLGNLDTDLGAVADAAASSDTGSFSVLAFIKRAMQNWTTLLARTPALGAAVTAASTPVSIASDQTVSVQGTRTNNNAAPGASSLVPTMAALANAAAPAWSEGNSVMLSSDLTGRLRVLNEQDTFITGQASQSASGNNVMLASAGTSSIDTVLSNGQPSYRSFYCQIIGSAGIASGAVTFEGSNDNTTFVTLSVYDDAVITGTIIQAAITIAASTNRFFSGKSTYRYVRCRISTVFSGGTIQAITRFSTADYIPRVLTVGNPTAANLTATVSGTVTASATVGPAAHDAAISGNPLRVAARALTANYTAVATGDVADLVTTLVGALINKPYSIPELDFVGIDSITNTTTATQIKNATASNKNYITGLSLAHATLAAAGEIQLRSTPVASTTATLSANTLVMAATYNWKVGDLVYVTASGVTGLSAGSYYYILTVSAANLTFSATRGGSTLVISGTTVSATLAKVLFRTQLQTTALPLVDINFPSPVDGGTNLAIEVCTPVAIATGRIDYNVRGYVAP